MASSAASALPAWVNRWRRRLSANGPPIRSYVSSTTIPALQPTTTGITQPPDNLVNLPRGIPSIGRTRVTPWSPPNESSFSRARSSVFHVTMIDQFSDDRRLPIRWIVVVYSSRNHFQSRHGGLRSAVFKQLLVILITACPYLPDIFNQKNNNPWNCGNVNINACAEYLKYIDNKNCMKKHKVINYNFQ